MSIGLIELATPPPDVEMSFIDVVAQQFGATVFRFLHFLHQNRDCKQS